MIAQMPFTVTWHIFQIIVNVFSPIVFTCVLNQSKSHWLLSDALHFAISICLKLKKKFRIFVSFYNFMEKESIFVFELRFLAFNIKFFLWSYIYIIFIYLFIFETWK